MASLTIDPRLYDGVILDLQSDAAVQALAVKLTQAGVATAARGTNLVAAAAQLGVAPERSMVLVGPDSGVLGVRAARDGGFAMVIAVNPHGDHEDLHRSGASVVVVDLDAIEVRTGDKRMSECPNALDCDDQVIGVIAERLPMMCLDYDGTLSDIVADPEAATLVAGAAQVLRQLATQCPVAILSGRDLADIHTRVGVPGIWYAGSHGFELIGPDGSRHQYDAACAALDVLTDAAAELANQVGQIPGARVEHKRFAVAMHYRNVAPDRVAEVVAAAHRQGVRRGLRITSGRKVVELRPDVDWDKGTALTWIGERMHQAGPVLPVYIGDDLTDEDAFDAVRLTGIGIVVRHSEDGNRPTAASFTLNSPAEVGEFLRRVSERLRVAAARG
ncbi:MAG: trehalose-phosphatase [Mycobacteriaceae bacterium]|nr:trehalose-phosphatase [Mycobacteriaceae bacterium]